MAHVRALLRRVRVRGFATERALVVDETGAHEMREFKSLAELPRQDSDASVTVRVTHSTINYKDAMILQGRPGLVPAWPIVPGIDAAGVVVASDDPAWREGDAAVITGNKIGQHFDGGYATLLRVQAGWLVRPPAGLDAAACMAIGSAGFTAMQCVDHLEAAGEITRWKGAGADGPVLVTGAGGGLGSMAIAILAKLGYHVVASTGRPDELGGALRALGAADVIGRLEHDPARPLGKQRWAAVVDAVGGGALAQSISETKYRGAVASTGVAAGGELHMTLYPLILRGVRVLGVDSTLPWNVRGYEKDEASWRRWRAEREHIWARLSHDLPREAIDACTSATVTLDELAAAGEDVLAGRHRGRVVVTVNS